MERQIFIEVYLFL